MTNPDENPQPASDGESSLRDPRLSPSFMRCLPRDGADGTVLLVGVVHDHPSSLYRVSHLLSKLAPDILALELPPLAMPLFEIYSRDDQIPPRMGGEMSVAFQTAENVRTVGIDAPNWAYLRELLTRVREERPSLDVVKRIGRDVVRGSLHAVGTRLGAAVASISPIRLRLYVHMVYEASLFDDPAAQADDEQYHVAQTKTLLKIIESPPWQDIIDETRELTMAEKIATLRKEGDVVVVVGIKHLDPLATHLTGDSADNDV